jgi:nitrate/nitrite transporter NarK
VVVGVGAVIGLLAFLVLSPDIPEPMAVMLLAAIGAFGSSYAVTMAHARSFYPPHLIGRGVTLMNFFSIGGAGAMQWLTGLVVETAAGASDLSAAYSTLFAFYAVTLAGAYFVYLFSTDAKPSAL